MTKNDWLGFVNKLISEDPRTSIGVKSKGEKFVFGQLDSAEELRLDYDVTLLPPKKYFLPPYEDLMEFDLSQPFAVRGAADETSRILIGVHPYDLIALQQMDKVYLGDNPDDNYKKRRENTLIIASDILNVSPYSFAASMGTLIVDSGYDLLITDLGDVVVIDEGSDAGRALIAQYGTARDATSFDVSMVETLRSNLASKYKKKVNAEKSEWSKLLISNYDHSVWDENSKKCLECGSCVFVCPTCYCYDVEDSTALNLKDGVRKRTWDACLLRGFAKIGSGEIFRENLLERYRHRYFRKGHYLPERYGFVACIGCGRCVSACLPDIADPSEVMNTLAAGPGPLAIPEAMETPVETPILIPKSATLKRVEKVTECETLFEIEKDDHTPLGHQPGQFVEVSIFGVGEAPISVSSAPGKTSFEIVVRKVGDLTAKLHAMKPGDKIGIRGPLGHGFDVEALRGKNLLFIAGGLGIVPMRSLVNYVLEHREEFNEVTVLYGCKEPNEFLFRDEIAKWHGRDDLVHRFTVNKCPEGQCWEGDIGVITTLIPKVRFDPKNTTAIVVGPPIMYRYVIRELKKVGMPDESIIISLERRMKCGVGKCGHCQINSAYVCQEGPVFNYSEIKDLPEGTS